MPDTAPPRSDSPQLTEQHHELLDQVLDKWSLRLSPKIAVTLSRRT
jgi:hypothetical protein